MSFLSASYVKATFFPISFSKTKTPKRIKAKLSMVFFKNLTEWYNKMRKVLERLLLVARETVKLTAELISETIQY